MRPTKLLITSTCFQRITSHVVHINFSLCIIISQYFQFIGQIVRLLCSLRNVFQMPPLALQAHLLGLCSGLEWPSYVLLGVSYRDKGSSHPPTSLSCSLGTVSRTQKSGPLRREPGHDCLFKACSGPRQCRVRTPDMTFFSKRVRANVVPRARTWLSLKAYSELVLCWYDGLSL